MNSKSLTAAVLLSGGVGTLPAVFADAAEAASQQNQQITRRIKVSANTANLEEYRKLAEFAKDLGATHLGADQIEPSMWQWNADRKDPYPNWSPQRPTLFKYIVPKELEKYLPADYAKRWAHTRQPTCRGGRHLSAEQWNDRVRRTEGPLLPLSRIPPGSTDDGSSEQDAAVFFVKFSEFHLLSFASYDTFLS